MINEVVYCVDGDRCEEGAEEVWRLDQYVMAHIQMTSHNAVLNEWRNSPPSTDIKTSRSENTMAVSGVRRKETSRRMSEFHLKIPDFLLLDSS